MASHHRRFGLLVTTLSWFQANCLEMALLIAFNSSWVADQWRGSALSWLIGGGGIEKSNEFNHSNEISLMLLFTSGIAVLWEFVGLPCLGLTASSIDSRLYAGFASDHDLNSTLSSPCLLTPTLISNVDLDGLDLMGNGPIHLGCKPWILIIHDYTWRSQKPKALITGMSCKGFHVENIHILQENYIK